MVVRGPEEARVRAAAGQLAEALAKRVATVADARLIGPAAAPLAKLRGKYRFHLILSGPRLPELRRVVSEVRDTVDLGEHVQWTIDVDPLDML